MKSIPTTGTLGASEYRLESAQGNGPLGTRWVVTSQTKDVQRVADLLAPNDDDYLNSLCENALRTKGWTTHSSVANVLEAGRLPDGTYFQILEMSPQAQQLSLGNLPISEPELLRVASSLQAGLMHMHKRELVHGALSPTCIYREGDRTQLGDLWWAHNADGEPLYGKLAIYFPASFPDFALQFASPEVLLGQSPKRESDIYSLGAVLFFLITGEPPRELSLPLQDHAYRKKLAQAPVKQLPSIRPDVSNMTCAMISKMLEADPVERLSIFWLEEILQELSATSH